MKSQDTAHSTKWNFNYTSSSHPSTGFLRAFDDSQKTALQFIDLAKASPAITDTDNNPIPYQRIGQYAFLPRIYKALIITIGDHSIRVHASKQRTLPVKTEQEQAIAEDSQVASFSKSDASYEEKTTDPEFLMARPIKHSRSRNLEDEKTPPLAKVGSISASETQPSPVSTSLSQPIWLAKAGSTLRESISTWADEVDWHVLWMPEDLDYPILADLRYEGPFESAVTEIFRAYEKAERPFWVNGNAAQKVLMVIEKNAPR